MSKEGKNDHWGIPPAKQVDLVTDNVYRDCRFLLYNVSRLGSDAAGSGGAGTYTLQTSCWPGGASYYILTPVPKTGDLNLALANPASIGGPLQGGAGMPLDVSPKGITGGYIDDQAIQQQHMAANSITAANAALAANAVVDANVYEVGVTKLIHGTRIFTGDVILSRGSGKPVIALNNAGINLFGVADGPGTAGLTSKPYVAIESAAISLFSGGNPSVIVTSSAITFYSVSGSTAAPYATLGSGGIVISDGLAPNPNYIAIDNTGLTIKDKNLANITVKAGVMTLTTPRTIPADGFAIAVLDGSGLKFSTGVGFTYMELKMDSGGIAISKGTSSVTVTSSQVNIVNGFLTTPQIVVYSGTVTINIDATNYVKVSDTATNRTAMLNHNYIRIEKTSDTLNFAQMIPGTVRVAGIGGTHQSFLDSTFVSVDGGQGVLYANQLLLSAVQVLSTRKTGPGFPPAFVDLSAVRTWCIALYSALAAPGGPNTLAGHGLIDDY